MSKPDSNCKELPVWQDAEKAYEHIIELQGKIAELRHENKELRQQLLTDTDWEAEAKAAQRKLDKLKGLEDAMETQQRMMNAMAKAVEALAENTRCC